MPFLPPGDLPDPGIKPTSPVSPALQVDSLLLSHSGSPIHSKGLALFHYLTSASPTLLVRIKEKKCECLWTLWKPVICSWFYRQNWSFGLRTNEIKQESLRQLKRCRKELGLLSHLQLHLSCGRKCFHRLPFAVSRVFPRDSHVPHIKVHGNSLCKPNRGKKYTQVNQITCSFCFLH